MEYFIGLLAGGFLGVLIMSTVSLLSKREDYERGVMDGYKRGITELQPFVRELQLRQYVAHQEGGK